MSEVSKGHFPMSGLGPVAHLYICRQSEKWRHSETENLNCIAHLGGSKMTEDDLDEDDATEDGCKHWCSQCMERNCTEIRHGSRVGNDVGNWYRRKSLR